MLKWYYKNKVSLCCVLRINFQAIYISIFCSRIIFHYTHYNWMYVIIVRSINRTQIFFIFFFRLIFFCSLWIDSKRRVTENFHLFMALFTATFVRSVNRKSIPCFIPIWSVDIHLIIVDHILNQSDARWTTKTVKSTVIAPLHLAIIGVHNAHGTAVLFFPCCTCWTSYYSRSNALAMAIDTSWFPSSQQYLNTKNLQCREKMAKNANCSRLIWLNQFQTPNKLNGNT